jgi:hypothetical protein
VQADTVKFIFVYWRPENIPIARKMKIGVFEGAGDLVPGCYGLMPYCFPPRRHSRWDSRAAGQIKRLFSPYHVDLEASSPAEISPQIVSDLLNSVTMRGSRVTDAKPATAATGAARAYTAPTEALKTGTGADNVRAAAGAAVTFEDESQLQGDIADVRNDSTATNWCLYGYKVWCACANVCCVLPFSLKYVVDVCLLLCSGNPVVAEQERPRRGWSRRGWIRRDDKLL